MKSLKNQSYRILFPLIVALLGSGNLWSNEKRDSKEKLINQIVRELHYLHSSDFSSKLYPHPFNGQVYTYFQLIQLAGEKEFSSNFNPLRQPILERSQLEQKSIKELKRLAKVEFNRTRGDIEIEILRLCNLIRDKNNPSSIPVESSCISRAQIEYFLRTDVGDKELKRAYYIYGKRNKYQWHYSVLAQAIFSNRNTLRSKLSIVHNRLENVAALGSQEERDLSLQIYQKFSLIFRSMESQTHFNPEKIFHLHRASVIKAKSYIKNSLSKMRWSKKESELLRGITINPNYCQWKKSQLRAWPENSKISKHESIFMEKWEREKNYFKIHVLAESSLKKSRRTIASKGKKKKRAKKRRNNQRNQNLFQ